MYVSFFFWSFIFFHSSVARGVEHFKASRYIEAMQQLNRALDIDPENVEGLVARGALWVHLILTKLIDILYLFQDFTLYIIH